MPRRATSTSFGGKSGNRRGSGPNKGEGGRPPEVFRQRMQLLASRDATAQRLEAALRSDDDLVFLKAFAEVANRGYGKAPEHVEHSGSVDVKHQVWKFGEKEVQF